MEAKTIGQFTGLIDSTGKEIYEDDIISPEDGRIGLVEFHNGSFVVNYGNNNRQALYDVQNWKMTILGNRFENPELLISTTQPKKNESSVQEIETSKIETELLAGK